MFTENRYSNLAAKIFSALCITAIIVCLICDYAVNKTVVWSGYPFIAIPFAWVIILPLLLAKRNKALFSLIALTVAIIPFLFFLERLTPANEWFRSLGLPAAAISIIAIWIMLAVVKFLKINTWFLSAIGVFLFGVVVSGAIKYLVSGFTGDKFLRFDSIVNFIACISITVLMAFIGYSKQQRDKLIMDAEKPQ